MWRLKYISLIIQIVSVNFNRFLFKCQLIFKFHVFLSKYIPNLVYYLYLQLILE